MCGDESLAAQLRAALAILGAENPEIAAAIAPILWRSCRLGRIQKFLKNDRSLDMMGYVRRVAEHFDAERDHVEALLAGDEKRWLPLYVLMQKWAYKLIEHRLLGGAPAALLRDRALACANSAALVILEKPFPFDVRFQMWVYQVVRNICLRHIADELQRNGSGRPGDEEPLDDEDNHQLNPAPTSELELLTHERQLELLDAVAQLSELRRQFIWLHYYEDKSFEAISALMNRKMNALYKLHHDALQELKSILGGR